MASRHRLNGIVPRCMGSTIVLHPMDEPLPLLADAEGSDGQDGRDGSGVPRPVTVVHAQRSHFRGSGGGGGETGTFLLIFSEQHGLSLESAVYEDPTVQAALLPEPVRRCIAFQLVALVAAMHARGVQHR
jgi:serine/threonine protein kinase